MAKAPIDYGRELEMSDGQTRAGEDNPLQAAILRGERILTNIEAYELLKHSTPVGKDKQQGECKP